MKLFSIGFTKKSASDFFELIRRNGIKLLVDIRLNNSSQLAGFSKKSDLRYFLREICGTEYIHEPSLAPTKDILDEYKRSGDWAQYEKSFLELLTIREIENRLDHNLFNTPTVFLCSEPEPEYCHRRLVLEYLKKKWGNIEISHL